MAAVLLACAHTAEVDHVRGDRRVQCACGVVSKVAAKPTSDVVYDVTDITPTAADGASAVTP